MMEDDVVHVPDLMVGGDEDASRRLPSPKVCKALVIRCSQLQVMSMVAWLVGTETVRYSDTYL